MAILTLRLFTSTLVLLPSFVKKVLYNQLVEVGLISIASKSDLVPDVRDDSPVPLFVDSHTLGQVVSSKPPAYHTVELRITEHDGDDSDGR